ncbi:adenylosuccinate lyase [Candidatus Bipolaricaulota bacterium]
MFKEISPLDGRYAAALSPLADSFSEFALARERRAVELLYLKALDAAAVFPSLSGDEGSRVDKALASFGEDDFARVKEIEAEINHDVKACELFLRERLSLAHPEMIHFGLTSADINNLAHARILKRYRDDHQLPQLRKLIGVLADLADAWKSIPFPARTHGQPASPTTAGKEVAVFLSRLLRQARQLEAHRFHGKLNGATGTYAALVTAAPDVDWPTFSRRFVESMGLEWSPCTTQIEGNDAITEYLGITARINTIVLDLDQDLWQYISRGEIVQKTLADEVGSSTMPHKVNPIRFENSEGNIAVANALLHALGDKLTQSRMQRDLSGSTVQRNVGVALAHSYLAIQQTLQGLGRIDIDRDAALKHVQSHPEVLAEAIQTILRVEGVNNPYDLLKTLTRGQSLTQDDLQVWIDGLDLEDAVKVRLRTLTPTGYVGLAPSICEDVVGDVHAWMNA